MVHKRNIMEKNTYSMFFLKEIGDHVTLVSLRIHFLGLHGGFFRMKNVCGDRITDILVTAIYMNNVNIELKSFILVPRKNWK